MTDGPDITGARWAPDPDDPSVLRWWDGAAWTDHRSAPVPSPAAYTATATGTNSDWPPERIGLLIGGGAVIVSSIGPWATVQTGFGSISVSGMDGDGKITIVGGGLVLLFAFIGVYVGAMIVSALTLALGIYEYTNVQNLIDEVDSDFARASVGWGIYGIIGGALAALILGIVMNRRKPSALSV